MLSSALKHFVFLTVSRRGLCAATFPICFIIAFISLFSVLVASRVSRKCRATYNSAALSYRRNLCSSTHYNKTTGGKKEGGEGRFSCPKCGAFIHGAPSVLCTYNCCIAILFFNLFMHNIPYFVYFSTN